MSMAVSLAKGSAEPGGGGSYGADALSCPSERIQCFQEDYSVKLEVPFD